MILIALLATSALAQKTKRNTGKTMPDTSTSRPMQSDTMNGLMAADTMDGSMDSTRMGARGCMCMMGPMMSKQMLLGRDGGVFIQIGNHLMKYDEKLNLVKDVTIQMDMDEMCKTMEEFMSRCPAMQKKTQDMMGPSGTPAR